MNTNTLANSIDLNKYLFNIRVAPLLAQYIEPISDMELIPAIEYLFLNSSEKFDLKLILALLDKIMLNKTTGTTGIAGSDKQDKLLSLYIEVSRLLLKQDTY